MHSLHRAILCLAGLCSIFLSWQSVYATGTTSVPAIPPAPARTYHAPQGAATAWLVPGLDPELWVSGHAGPRLALKGAGQHFVAVEWAPDGRSLAVLVVPTGSETAGLGQWWLISPESTAPAQFAPDVPAWVAPVRDERPTAARPDVAMPAADLTPPATIRVYHSLYNTCRDLPVGTITVVPFEEYVARVLPAEVYVSWPAATLQAQAVAIRTYAWYQILRAGAEYDVTDSTSYQYMCDIRYPATDAAVAATQGYYMAYNGQVILTQYSAENGHPTLDGGLPYLKPVMDPVSLGKTRNGHGHGLSQWGAQRWAKTHAWNAVQILTHYYQGAELIDPIGQTPLLSLVSPAPGTWLTGAMAYLRAHSSGIGAGPVSFSTAAFSAQDDDPAGGWTAQWMLPATLTGSVSLSALAPGASHALTLPGLDRVAPTGTLRGPDVSPTASVTLQLTTQDLGSGAASLALGRDVQIPATDFRVVSGAGTLIVDPNTSSGHALSVPAGASASWQAILPTPLAPDRIYQAYVRVRIPTAPGTSAASLLRVELYDPDTNSSFGFLSLRAGDWRQIGSYQDFTIDFWLPPAAGGRMAARLQTTGSAQVVLDRLRILPAPAAFSTTAHWTLSTQAVPETVVAKIIDRAGNVSEDLLSTLLWDDAAPPAGWQIIAPLGWVTTTVHPTVSARVDGEATSLDAASAAARFSSDAGATWTAWAPASIAGAVGGGTLLSATWEGGAGAENNLVQFRVANRAGLTSTSPSWPVLVDLTPPQVTGTLLGTPNSSGWITTPVTITLGGADAGSGLARIDYQIVSVSANGAQQNMDEWQTYAGALSLTGEGDWLIRYRAVDRAGLPSPVQELRWRMDNIAPVAWLSVTAVIAEDQPVTLHWTAREGNQTVWYDVQVSEDGLVWRDWRLRTPLTSAEYGAMPGTPLWVRTRAADIAGNIGPWSLPLKIVVARSFSYLPIGFGQ